MAIEICLNAKPSLERLAFIRVIGNLQLKSGFEAL